MDCETCKNKFSDYFSSDLPAEKAHLVKAHLDQCADCQKAYSIYVLTEQVIAKERAVPVNPFIGTRVMAGIEAMDRPVSVSLTSSLRKGLQPVFIAASIVVAIMLGISVGNAYTDSMSKTDIPTELIVLNDASMESLDLLVND